MNTIHIKSEKTRITIICGSLEHGRDGVGDYTRRLAGELIRNGYPVTIIALNDQHITDAQEATQPDLQENIPSLRLPATMSWQQRIKRVKNFINQFDPEWISLQYVPYAYQKKGLPFMLFRYLQQLGKNRKWQVMFHELWVGKEDGAAWKVKMIAATQQYIINHMLSSLRPVVIHTQLPAYKKQLEQLGWQVKPLPLFSNIPMTQPVNKKEDSSFTIAFFSQVDASLPIMSFLKKLQQDAQTMRKPFQILLLGGSKNKMSVFKEQLSELENAGASIEYSGFLTPENLSAVLQTCTLGITPVVKHGLGKSGSVAAFLEHGIPVAVPIVDAANKEDPPFLNADLSKAILIEPDLKQIVSVEEAAQKAKRIISLAAVTDTFISDISDLMKYN